MHRFSIPLNLSSLFESGFVIADGSVSLALSSFKQSVVHHFVLHMLQQDITCSKTPQKWRCPGCPSQTFVHSGFVPCIYTC